MQAYFPCFVFQLVFFFYFWRFFFFFNILFLFFFFFGRKKAKKSHFRKPTPKIFKPNINTCSEMNPCACFLSLPPLPLLLIIQDAKHGRTTLLNTHPLLLLPNLPLRRLLLKISLIVRNIQHAVSFTMWLGDTWPHPHSITNCHINEMGNTTLPGSVEIFSTLQVAMSGVEAGGRANAQNIPSFKCLLSGLNPLLPVTELRTLLNEPYT